MTESLDKSALFYRDKDRYAGIALLLVKKAVAMGAGQAEVYLEWGLSSDIQVRIGKPETVRQSNFKGLGLRVFQNGRGGFASTTDFSAEALDRAARQAVSLAAVSGEDKHNGLPELSEIEETDFHLLDDFCLNMSIDRKIELARTMEEAAFAVDPRIVNSEGSVFQDACRGTIIANSNGLSGEYYKSHYSMHVAPVIEHEGERRYSYWYSSGTHYAELETPESIGRKAGERVLRMLGAKKVPTRRVPVVFDPIIASGFLGTVMNCVDGEARAKRETCLWDKMGTKAASNSVTIFDDGRRDRGVGSHAFDGEGVSPRTKTVFDGGTLVSFLYDTYSARKDGRESTGNGMRTYRTQPTVQGTNFYLKPGNETPEEIIRSVGSGLYVTGLIGFGINIVNGDYSRGAEGIWIENGELTYPVHEVTVSGNILEMLKGIEAAGNDIRYVSASSAPTILINEMVVSGK